MSSTWDQIDIQYYYILLHVELHTDISTFLLLWKETSESMLCNFTIKIYFMDIFCSNYLTTAYILCSILIMYIVSYLDCEIVKDTCTIIIILLFQCKDNEYMANCKWNNLSFYGLTKANYMLCCNYLCSHTTQ